MLKIWNHAKAAVCLSLFGVFWGVADAAAQVQLLDESFSLGEMVNGLRSETVPAGWQFYWWHSSGKGPLGGLSKEKFFDPPSALMVPAVGQGMAGWHSAPLRLAKPFQALTVKGKVLLSDDYAGNSPGCFIGWYGQNQFIKPVFLPMVASNEKGQWQDFTVMIKAEEIPTDADSFTINLVNLKGEAPISPAGKSYFDNLRVTREPQPGLAVKLRGEQLANCWTLDQAVVFRAQGQVPGTVTAISGTVFDSAGRKVADVTASAENFKAAGWRWQPAAPGFYQIEFAGLTAAGREPLAEEFVERAAVTNRLGTFSQSRVNVAILPRAAADAKIAEIFGFHIICSPGTLKWRQDSELRMAKLIGASFIRFHVQWSEVETAKGTYNWAPLDYFVAKSIELGLQPVVCFYGTPRWASSRPDDTRVLVCVYGYSAYAPKNLDDWSDFLRAMVSRYKDRVRTWEVWNEPHLPGFSCYWQDTSERFVKMQASAYRTIKEIQPDSEIWLGGIGMRYLPFYEAIVKQGAGKDFDVLALHGHGVNPNPFYAIDKEYHSPVHPWVASEWHAVLLRFGDPAFNQGEQERALRMLLDWLRQVKLGAERICFFELVNLCDKETLAFYAAEKMPLNHASGLFRRQPYVQPLFGSVVMGNFTRQFQGQVRLEGEYQFGNQKGVLLSSQAGPLLLFWQETEGREVIDPRLLSAIGKDSPVVSWEGKPVLATPGFELESRVMYFCRGPRIPATWTPASDVLSLARKKLELKGPSGGYGSRPLIDASGRLIAANAIWNDAGWQSKFQEPPSGNNSARFALAVAGEEIALAVATVDPIHHQPSLAPNLWQGDSIEFAFDCLNEGYPEDRAEFQAALTTEGPQLFKSKAPSLAGDIPTAWSPEGAMVKNGAATIQRTDDGRTLYLVKFKKSELYPLVIGAGAALRFSLLVNDNNGKARAGWLNWGGGIVESKDPVFYGTLKPITKTELDHE
jgi:hypothetical protein